MPNQDRVNPFGEIIATKFHGALMGNRGELKTIASEEKKLLWNGKRWISCALSTTGTKEKKDDSIKYTRLFFLDEATALSAGHRPCYSCRREDYKKFIAAWLKGNTDAGLDDSVKVEKIDQRIHSERVTSSREKESYTQSIDELPDGVMIERQDRPREAWLLWKGKLHKWDSSGYKENESIPHGKTVSVLTPRSIVRAIEAGYIPAVAL